MRSAIVTACFILACGVASAANAARTHSLASALPPGASLGQQRAIKGATGTYAVAYRESGWFLGIVSTRASAPRLTWHRTVTGTPDILDSPVPGTFRLTTDAGGSAGQDIYAEKLRGGSAVSAIKGSAQGVMTSARRIALTFSTFALGFPDTSHVGSVDYVLVHTYSWNGSLYGFHSLITQPDYPAGTYPAPSGWTTTSQGNTYLLRLEIADTEAKRELGLMYRNHLDGDAGMIFIWPSLTHESFWMANTPIPLDIAWLGADGIVQEIQQMQAESTTLHTPSRSYQYAIEANLGYFERVGIVPGDRYQLDLSGSPKLVAGKT